MGPVGAVSGSSASARRHLVHPAEPPRSYERVTAGQLVPGFLGLTGARAAKHKCRLFRYVGNGRERVSKVTRWLGRLIEAAQVKPGRSLGDRRPAARSQI